MPVLVREIAEAAQQEEVFVNTNTPSEGVQRW
jgi:hypothetical protein